MAQWVTYVLCNHKDHSLDPQTPHEVPGGRGGVPEVSPDIQEVDAGYPKNRLDRLTEMASSGMK